jgi:hypothetical protein
MEFLPHPPSVSRQRNAGSARQRIAHGASLRRKPEGSAACIVARKGKEVEIPVQSSMLVRIDNTVTMPA